MVFAGFNVAAVVLAMVASMAIGAVWYSALSPTQVEWTVAILLDMT